MNSSVSQKDEVCFLRVCHPISNAVYNRTKPGNLERKHSFFWCRWSLCGTVPSERLSAINVTVGTWGPSIAVRGGYTSNYHRLFGRLELCFNGSLLSLWLDTWLACGRRDVVHRQECGCSQQLYRGIRTAKPHWMLGLVVGYIQDVTSTATDRTISHGMAATSISFCAADRRSVLTVKHGVTFLQLLHTNCLFPSVSSVGLATCYGLGGPGIECR